MANSSQILDKIKRNLEQMGVPATRGASSVVASGLTISYSPASIQAPMGGVDGDSSPFLGMGIANPGKIKIKGAAGENSIAAMCASEADAKVWAVCSRFANNVIAEAGDTTAQLAEIQGHPDLLSMGQ
jgi:hypothetical protein